MQTIERHFFNRETCTVAEDLVGCHLTRYIGTQRIVVQINETEAYKGEKDPASHAYRGMTNRNRVMFGPPGHLYMYISYGMHICMNIVTGQEGKGRGVLIRGADPIEGIEHIRQMRPGIGDAQLINGPGKLCQGLGLTMDFYGYDIVSDNDQLIRIEAPNNRNFGIKRTPRIGISKAVERPWRFLMVKP